MADNTRDAYDELLKKTGGTGTRREWGNSQDSQSGKK